MIRFNLLKLKGLFATCYEGSRVSQHQLQLFDDEEYKGIPYKIQIYQEDIDLLLEENNRELSQESIKQYIKKHKKAKKLKGNGSFDSPECVELLKQCDIVITNEPFSLMRPFVNLLMEYNKKFLIIGNKNAITYKEIFPLIKDNKMWLGYTQPKEFKTPTGELTKKLSGLTRWYTNLDIPKRHDELIMYKPYSPEAYPRYDNYDAINVDRVSDIPCDYCESWGVTQEEYSRIHEKSLWEITREETRENQKILFVIPAKGTKLRDELHEHMEKYREKIEEELGKAIYCSGCVGVPITVLDKYNPEQFEILNPNDLRVDNPENEPIIANAGMQECRNAGMQECRNAGMQECRNAGMQECRNAGMQYLRLEQMDGTSMENASMREYSCARYCNGIIGVPITFLDKWNPEQFKIITMSTMSGRSANYWSMLNGKSKYSRIFVQKIL